MYIYVNTAVVAGAPNHTIFTETTRKATTSSAIADALSA
jgi:hypothetical protein